MFKDFALNRGALFSYNISVLLASATFSFLTAVLFHPGKAGCLPRTQLLPGVKAAELASSSCHPLHVFGDGGLLDQEEKCVLIPRPARLPPRLGGSDLNSPAQLFATGPWGQSAVDPVLGHGGQ